MSSRKFNFEHLTPEQLDKIAAVYPDAVEIVRRPNYKILAMLTTCKVQMPDGIKLIPDEKPAFLHNIKEKNA